MPESSSETPRNRRFIPLYGKILLWFFVNILLVGVAAVWMVLQQFGLDRTLLLTRDGRARIQVRAEQTIEALASAGADRAAADTVMDRLGEDEGMAFGLFEFNGTQLAGRPLTLPPLVRERLATGRFRGGPPGRAAESPGLVPGQPGRPPLPGQDDFLPPQGPPDGQNFERSASDRPLGERSPGGRPNGDRPANDRLEGERMPGDRPEAERPGAERAVDGIRRRDRLGGEAGRGQWPWREAARVADFPKEAMRTEYPTRYWLITRLPPVPESPGRGRPLALIGMAESLGQSELLFDPKPWLLGALGLFAASALLWWPFVRGLTRSLAQMRGATERVARGDFAVRVDESRGDELGHLGAAVNAMTGRLEGFVGGQKRFLGDIAHELCSPLARMEMALGILEQRTPIDLRERVGDVREEVREMSTLVNELLAFSKAGLQGTAAARERVALAPLVEAAVTRETDGARVVIDIPADLVVTAAPSLLTRAIANILRNARHYAGTAGPIEITASRTPSRPASPTTPSHILLTVADHGPGVPVEALPRLFDPFFRVDPARTRETGGVGLGLAIVKSCVEACGGTARGMPRPDGGRGLVIELALPAA